MTLLLSELLLIAAFGFEALQAVAVDFPNPRPTGTWVWFRRHRYGLANVLGAFLQHVWHLRWDVTQPRMTF